MMAGLRYASSSASINADSEGITYSSGSGFATAALKPKKCIINVHVP